ncbi:unnamed protein product [Nippostrongylus brasiliensis]|uniref:Unspecific monooxygenase n=1 Tax=Nippostrongylus brasiliensis TaxID=27835 RepID=A0A158R355_NIPBR|nr:unnamed protein product [Nippostrongylus brasiliensis]
MLLITLLDLWIAGQETTVTTLYWSFAYLLRNLDFLCNGTNRLHVKVMSRVEQELFSVTKGERPLSLADKPSTPYYNATLTRIYIASLQEIHRCASLASLFLWRVAAEDTTVGSYAITKGTAVASQNTVIMNDEKFFKHHEQFNPDRYLNGNKLDRMVAPFGLGKRSCLGESLARAELYLVRPFPLPLIGNVHQLAYGMFVRKMSIIEILQEWAKLVVVIVPEIKKYGSVHTFWFGPMATVNVCDYDLAVEAMVKKGSNFADRFSPYLLTMIRNGRGVIISNGPPWLEQRRFALHTLRNFGLGRNLIEERIMFEFNISHLHISPSLEFEIYSSSYRCEALDKRINAGENSIEPHTSFDLLIGNIINRLLFTDRFEKQRINRLIKPTFAVLDFVRKQIEQRKRAISNGSHVLLGEGDDFVDAFLIQMAKDEASGEPSSFDNEMLVMTLFDLWLAGQETTVTMLYWSFVHLLLNPKVSSQQTFQAEDTTVGPYTIPKGTAIAAQIALIMNDERHFQNHREFNPERYLNGNKLDQMVVPFGLGKRSCLGESLARAELYLIIANLLLRYKISADPDFMPCTKAMNEKGTMRRPQSYHICLEHR